MLYALLLDSPYSQLLKTAKPLVNYALPYVHSKLKQIAKRKGILGKIARVGHKLLPRSIDPDDRVVISGVYESATSPSPAAIDGKVLQSILDPSCTSLRVPLRDNCMRTAVCDPHLTFSITTSPEGTFRCVIYPDLHAMNGSTGLNHINTYFGSSPGPVPIDPTDASQISYTGPINNRDHFYSSRVNSMALQITRLLSPLNSTGIYTIARQSIGDNNNYAADDDFESYPEPDAVIKFDRYSQYPVSQDVVDMLYYPQSSRSWQMRGYYQSSAINDNYNQNILYIYGQGLPPSTTVAQVLVSYNLEYIPHEDIRQLVVQRAAEPAYGTVDFLDYLTVSEPSM